MNEQTEKLGEKIVEIIEDNIWTTEGEYSPLAGPITSDETELLISPKELADQLLQVCKEAGLCFRGEQYELDLATVLWGVAEIDIE